MPTQKFQLFWPYGKYHEIFNIFEFFTFKRGLDPLFQLEFPLPNNVLCQGWSKFKKLFWRSFVRPIVRTHSSPVHCYVILLTKSYTRNDATKIDVTIHRQVHYCVVLSTHKMIIINEKWQNSALARSGLWRE